MNGSLNSDKDWKFSPDSYGDFYGGLRERPSTVHNEPVNDHHELPPDAFRRMEIPECTNERRSSLSVLLERESPVVLPKDITHDDDEVYTPPVDTSPTTTSTFSSLEMLPSQLPSALKKIPMHEHDQFAANTHWMKIVANVSSDSEDSDSDEEGSNDNLLSFLSPSKHYPYPVFLNVLFYFISFCHSSLFNLLHCRKCILQCIRYQCQWGTFVDRSTRHLFKF